MEATAKVVSILDRARGGLGFGKITRVARKTFCTYFHGPSRNILSGFCIICDDLFDLFEPVQLECDESFACFDRILKLC